MFLSTDTWEENIPYNQIFNTNSKNEMDKNSSIVKAFQSPSELTALVKFASATFLRDILRRFDWDFQRLAMHLS